MVEVNQPDGKHQQRGEDVAEEVHKQAPHVVVDVPAAAVTVVAVVVVPPLLRLLKVGRAIDRPVR